MSRKINNTLQFKWFQAIGLAVFATLVLTSTGFGAGAGQAHGIQRIAPFTEVRSYRSNMNAADHFDIVGILNSAEGNQVIIGDRQLTLAPGVRTNGMKQYNLVGANLGRSGEIVKLELVSDEPN